MKFQIRFVKPFKEVEEPLPAYIAGGAIFPKSLFHLAAGYDWALAGPVPRKITAKDGVVVLEFDTLMVGLRADVFWEVSVLGEMTFMGM